MLKRIVVTGDRSLVEALSQAAGPREFEVLALEDGQELPTGTVAVAGDGRDAAALVAAAGALGARHEAVLGLIGEALDVREALGRLPADLKAIVILRYFHELELREVADVLDVNLSTVKTRLYRALRLLRVEVEDDHE